MVSPPFVMGRRSASPAFIDDLRNKVQKAKNITGLRFLHILSPCPPGWKADPADSITLARLAVECNIFPLFEIENGEKVRLSYSSSSLSVSEYLRFLMLKEIERSEG